MTDQDLLHLFEVDEDNEDYHSVNARNASAKISIRTKKTFTATCSEPFSSAFWKCDIDEDQIEAVEGRLVWVDLHDFQGFDLVPQMSLEAKEAFEEANPSARINEHQCWPLHLPDICHPHPNAEAAADVNATHPTSPPVSLQTRMRSALQVSVESEIHNQPGIDNDMCPRSDNPYR